MRKVKEFITKAGFTKLFYLLIGLFFAFTGSNILAGAAFGIFFYINYNVLEKIIKDNFKNK